VGDIDQSRSRRGKAARRKGYSVERNLVTAHLERGVHAERVPLSGGSEYHKGDVVIGMLGGLRSEVKSRKDGGGFKTLEEWLGDDDLLFLHRNGMDPLAVVPWKTWEKILAMVSGADPQVVAPKRVTKHICPMDFQPRPEDAKLAISLGVNPEVERQQMIDWSHSDASKNKKTDWHATYRNWVRRKAGTRPRQQFHGSPYQRPSAPVDDGAVDILKEAEQRKEDEKLIRERYGK